MNNRQIIQTISASATLLGQEYDGLALSHIDLLPSTYRRDELMKFQRDLIEAGNRVRIIYMEHSLPAQDFYHFLQEMEIPIVVFKKEEQDYVPVILYTKHKKLRCILVTTTADVEVVLDEKFVDECYQDSRHEVIFLGFFSYKSLISKDPDSDEQQKPLTPVQRLLRLLSEEKKDITYIYIYAIFIGLISLSLPVGIQATISLVSGGVFFSSIYILITLVIVGVLAAGGLQIMQITLVEYLQRRVFTKVAFEFAFRVPRIKEEALRNYHAPELINRFFDVLTLQKGLPKLLIDISAGSIQILFGLILLSFYHPFFVFFGLLLLGLLFLIFYLTGPKGLSSSIQESKYKYKVVSWLEELARTINSFKISGNTPLPVKKTNYNVNNYLKYRKTHFRVLINQYTFFLVFKAIITGGLLSLGTLLVVQREITLGQFVASEVIIILILSSVEKIIMYLDVVYDMLTAVDKIAHVTDLPLEKNGGFNLLNPRDGLKITIRDLNYQFPGKLKRALHNINLNIEKGERMCIAGPEGSGKTLLTSMVAGLHTDFDGLLTIDGFSIRDLDLTNLRDKIGKNVSREDIFEGTILENLMLAKPQGHLNDVMWALNEVGISDAINLLPEGLHTPMISGGKGLSGNLVQKIILARCLIKRPYLLIINDYFHDFSKAERRKLIHNLVHTSHLWTLIVVSNDPIIMEACDRVVLMEQGIIKDSGSFEMLMEKGVLVELIN